MRIVPSREYEISSQTRYRDRKPAEVIATRRTQEANVYWKDQGNRSVPVKVQSRFAVTPDSNPTIHNDVTFIDDPAREEGVTDLTDQMDMLFAAARGLIPCSSCELASIGECGINRGNVESRFTDPFDPPSQKVAGLTHAQELRAGTKSSDVKCIQP